MTNQILVSPVAPEEITLAATTLYHAFYDDPLIRWLFVDENNYQKNGLRIYEGWVKYCVLYGKALKTPHFESVGLRRKPGDDKLTFWRLLRSGMYKAPRLLGKQSFQRILEFEALSLQAKQQNMGEDLFWYCWALGTETQFQNKGFGNAIMNYTFELAQQDQLPCYLETASENSLQIHLHKGYRLVSEFILPDSTIKIFTMLR